MKRIVCVLAGLAFTVSAGTAAAQVPTSVPVTPEQAQTEIQLTELLNQLFQMGFISELHSIRRVEDSYVAEITTVEFERMTLEIDARTGQIAQR